MNAFKWDDLRVFLAVARTGTLAGAASELHVNASTAHRRIGVLEASLGAELFGKDPRGYSLTPSGEALLPHAMEVEDAVLTLRRAVNEHDRTARGPVTLTMPETLLELVAPHLARVRDTCPGLRPIVVAEDRVLALGVEVDVALRPGVPPADAVGRRVGTLAWALYHHCDTNGVDPQILPWVVYTDRGGALAARRWRQRKHAGETAMMEVSSVGAMHRVISSTPAQGLLPCYLGDATPALVRATPPLEDASSELWLLIHADLRRSARVRALVDLLMPGLKQLRGRLAGDLSAD